MFRYRTYQSRFGFLSNSVQVPNGPTDSNTLTPLQIAQSKGVPFFLYDFARTDLTFQEENGYTAADDPSEAVGLALSIDTIGTSTLDAYLAAQPELWTGQTPTIFSSGGTAGAYDPVTQTMTNTGTAFGGYPRFRFGGLTANKRYHVSGVLTGSRTKVSVLRLAGNGSLNNMTYNSATGLFSGRVVSLDTYLEIALDPLANWTGADSVTIVSLSIKEIPGNHAVQSGAGTLRPVRQAGNVLRFDAADDNLLSTLAGAAAGNAFIAKVTVPVSLAATQVVAGFNAGSNGRFQVAINTSGQICAGVGANSTTSHVGTVDHRGQTGVLAVIEDGSNVKIYWNGVEEHSAARNGAPDAAVPYRLGSNNNNGTAANFFGGDIRFAAALKGAVFTPTEIISISNQWNATL